MSLLHKMNLSPADGAGLTRVRAITNHPERKLNVMTIHPIFVETFHSTAEEVGSSPQAFMIHPVGTVDVCTKFHGNTFSNC